MCVCVLARGVWRGFQIVDARDGGFEEVTDEPLGTGQRKFARWRWRYRGAPRNFPPSPLLLFKRQRHRGSGGTLLAGGGSFCFLATARAALRSNLRERKHGEKRNSTPDKPERPTFLASSPPAASSRIPSGFAMGKEQELLEAARTGNLAAVEKLLSGKRQSAGSGGGGGGGGGSSGAGGSGNSGGHGASSHPLSSLLRWVRSGIRKKETCGHRCMGETAARDGAPPVNHRDFKSLGWQLCLHVVRFFIFNVPPNKRNTAVRRRRRAGSLRFFVS